MHEYEYVYMRDIGVSNFVARSNKWQERDFLCGHMCVRIRERGWVSPSPSGATRTNHSYTDDGNVFICAVCSVPLLPGQTGQPAAFCRINAIRLRSHLDESVTRGLRLCAAGIPSYSHPGPTSLLREYEPPAIFVFFFQQSSLMLINKKF